MCGTKALVISISIILLVAASFSVYQAHTENKMGHHSKIKSQGPCENEYKKYCLNGGGCYYLVDEDFVGCYLLTTIISKSNALYFFQPKI